MPSDPWTPAAFDGRAFTGFRDLLDVFAQYPDWPTLLDYETHWLAPLGVVTVKGVPLRLIEQPPKPRRAKQKERRALYDVSVVDGALPTRSRNWHDFFNVMMFAAFPRTKQQLHARHRDILERNLPVAIVRLPGARTEEQDCLTILDEGGVVLVTAPSAHDAVSGLLDAGQHHQLRNLIDDGAVSPWLFGHAHLEHLAKHHATSRPPLPDANTATSRPTLPVANADASRPPLPAANTAASRPPLRDANTATSRPTLPVANADASRSPQLPYAKAILLELAPNAPRAEVDAALAKTVSLPEFCSTRDWRRPIALNDLYLDLPRTEE